MDETKPKRTLAEEMEILFDDAEVKEMIALGKLPPDIAQIAADALEKKSDTPASRPISLGSTEPYMYIASLIQKKFWPKAPELKRGGFMSMLAGTGPPPAWVIIMQVAAQITDKARECGIEVPESDGEKSARELDKLREFDNKYTTDLSKPIEKMAEQIEKIDEAKDAD